MPNAMGITRCPKNPRRTDAMIPVIAVQTAMRTQSGGVSVAILDSPALNMWRPTSCQ
jgi:hypothetical protein